MERKRLRDRYRPESKVKATRRKPPPRGPALTWLTEARKKVSLTQAELGVAMGGLTQGIIGNWESGRKPVPEERVRALAHHLGLDVWVVEVGLGRIPGDLEELRCADPARIVAAIKALPPPERKPAAPEGKGTARPAGYVLDRGPARR